MVRTYYYLTKPGIIYGNSVTAIAGFLLAERGQFDFKLFATMLIGLSLVIASGCVFNNIFDAGIDARMARTQKRAMVTGAISKKAAVIFGIVLIVLGLTILYLFTNAYCLFSALLGFVVYVFLYTPLKHRTVNATLVGAIAGATPPVVGYTAVSGRPDSGALILFLILIFWQMPHFYAIAIRRLNDYKEAGVPVLPLKIGVSKTKIYILVYIILYLLASLSLVYFKITGWTYFTILLVLGLWWLLKAAKGFKVNDDATWAKKLFLFSLIVLTAQSLILALNFWLP